jgi:hypothetical protein
VGKNSFYVEHGDWFVALSAGFALLAGALLAMGGLPSLEADLTTEAGTGE